MGLDSPILLLIIIAFSGFLYFLPSIIGRNKRNFISILLLNIFLGWTFIGWIVAIIWAVSPDQQSVVFYNNTPTQKPDKTDELIKFKQLLDNEAITQEEYDNEKNRILNR